MKKRFFFRKPSQFTFDMWVVINDDKHEANFLASMGRKGYSIVTEDIYYSELQFFAQFRTSRLSYGRRP